MEFIKDFDIRQALLHWAIVAAILVVLGRCLDLVGAVTSAGIGRGLKAFGQMLGIGLNEIFVIVPAASWR